MGCGVVWCDVVWGVVWCGVWPAMNEVWVACDIMSSVCVYYICCVSVTESVCASNAGGVPY